MHSIFIDLPEKDFSNGKWEQKEALVLEKTEWDRIRGHMQFLHKDSEYAEEQHLLREKLKEKSKFMIKDWGNTLQNVRERRLASNKARLEAIEKKKSDVQKAFRKEEAAERKKYLDKCEKALYYNKDNVKMLNQSLRFSEVLRTREAQITLDKKLKELEVKKEQEYAEKCRKDVEEFKKEKQLEEKKRIEKRIMNKEELLAQIKEKVEKKLEEEQENEREREDLLNIKREIKMAEECAENEIAMRKEGCRKEINDYLEKEKEFKEKKKHKEDIENKLTEIYGRAKQKIEKMRKEKEQKMRDESLKKKEERRNYLATLMERKADDEDELIKKAVAEKEVIAESKRLKKLAYQQRLKEERIQNHKEFLEREAQAKKEEEEIRKWQLMQRFKNNEVNSEFYKQRHEEHLANIEEVRESYQKQIEEREEIIRNDREEEEKDHRQTLKQYDEEDNAFLKYADEIIQDSMTKGRYLRPIMDAVEDYKKRCGLNSTQKAQHRSNSRIPYGPQPEKTEPRSWGPCMPKMGPCATKK